MKTGSFYDFYSDNPIGMSACKYLGRQLRLNFISAIGNSSFVNYVLFRPFSKNLIARLQRGIADHRT